jgi:hypothetical protein
LAAYALRVEPAQQAGDADDLRRRTGGPPRQSDAAAVGTGLDGVLHFAVSAERQECSLQGIADGESIIPEKVVVLHCRRRVHRRPREHHLRFFIGRRPTVVREAEKLARIAVNECQALFSVLEPRRLVRVIYVVRH